MLKYSHEIRLFPSTQTQYRQLTRYVELSAAQRSDATISFEAFLMSKKYKRRCLAPIRYRLASSALTRPSAQKCV